MRNLDMNIYQISNYENYFFFFYQKNSKYPVPVMCIRCFQWIFIGIGNPIGRFGRIGRFRSSNKSCALETSNQILYYWNWPLEDSNTASNPSNTTSNTFQSQIYIDNLKILFNYNK